MRWAALWLMVGAGCGTTAPSGVEVTGLVMRGPITPVCQDGVACDAPVAGSFAVRSVAGSAARGFRTGTDGRFAVRLAPGDYRVEWLDNPLGQADQPGLAVGPEGAAGVVLHFDTGVR